MKNYDLKVKYANKLSGKSFVDYLGLTIFNFMPFEFKKGIIGGDNVNNKCLVYKYSILELENDMR